MDPELSDIVFVKKDQMEEWKQSQEMLKYQLALTKKRIEIKLEDQKKKFDRQYQEIKKQKDLDINDLKKRYDDLTKQKQLQDKQNFHAMQKMEANHLKQVIDTQQMYEKKLTQQESEYLNLEQDKLEMQQSYEQKIQALIGWNNRKIKDLLGSFKTDLNKVQDEYEECKRTASANKRLKED